MSTMKDKVQAWLAKSGYPLELFAHECLREKGYICEKSPLYTDIESGSEREIDISAEKSYGDSDDYYFSIQLLVECKKSEKPLVVLSSSAAFSTVRAEIYGARVWPSVYSNASVLAGVGYQIGVSSDNRSLPFSRQVRPGYSVLQAFTTSDELFHRTLYGLAKAEHYFEEQHERTFELSVGDEHHRVLPLTLHLCLLVVDAPLLSAFLENGEMKVEECDVASVTLNLPWTPRPESERRANIQVVARESLPMFLRELNEFSEWIWQSGAIGEYTNKSA